jgi:hypothetical protein
MRITVYRQFLGVEAAVVTLDPAPGESVQDTIERAVAQVATSPNEQDWRVCDSDAPYVGEMWGYVEQGRAPWLDL